MESKTHYTIVGIFVITLISAAIFTTIWLSSDVRTKEHKTYLIFMNESVAGLNINAPVKYNGVDVGNVSKISLSEKNPKQVRLLVNIVLGTPITQGTTATLITQGLTGVAYIGLQGDDSDEQPLLPVHGEKYPVIKSIPSFFSRLDTSLQILTNNVNVLAWKIENLLNKQNQKAISKTLSHLAEFTEHLSANGKNIDKLLQSTALASQQLPALTQQLAQETIPAATRLINNLNKAGNNLIDITNDIKQNPSVLVRGQAQPSLGPGEK